MIFEIKTQYNGEYFIINKDKIIQYYDYLYDLIIKYKDFIKYLQFINLYEYLTPYTLNSIDNKNNLLYNDIYNYFSYLEKKYFYSTKLINNKDLYLSILLYQPIDKLFPSYYELFYKYFKHLNNLDILEISNTTFGIESLGYLSKKFNLNYNLNICITKSNDTNLNNRIEMIRRVINNITILNTTNIFNDNKYDLILLSNKTFTNYWTTCYDTYSSNKYMILYLLKSLKILKYNGNIVMRFYNYTTNIQKEIYYLFRSLFEKTKLYIPECNNLDFFTGGFIIGFNYNNNIINFDDIIKKIEQLDDNIYIEFDKYFNKFKFISDIIIEQDKTNKSQNIYSFYNIEENDKYNKKLEEYSNKYMDKVLYNLNNIDYYINNKNELIKLKLSKAISWCLKYNFDIQSDFSYMNYNNDYINDIIIELNKYDNYQHIHKYQLISNNNINMDLSTLINKITKLNQKHILITNYIDTRDTRIYRKVRLEFDSFYQKIRKFININLDKKYLNQPFFKLYEILELTKLLDNKTSYKSFHLCELPGSFIFSLDYYIKTKTNIKDFKWKAQSLNEPNIAKLEDSFKMLNKYKNNYDFGPKNNGNLIYDYNINYYFNHIEKNEYDLITADCGMPLDKDNCDILSNLESNILLLILKTKKDGISKIVYPFHNNDIKTIIMIGLLNRYYDKIYFYKSEQCYTSNEFYIIFKDFNKNKIDNDYGEIYKTDLNNIIKLEKYVKKEFYYTFYKIYKKLMIIKIKAIKFKIYLLDRYHIISNNQELIKYIDDYNKDIILKWLNKFNFI